MIRLTRRYRFCASHRLHSKVLSDEQNSEAYGKCNNAYGHGHDYLLHVTIAGPVDERTGQLVRIEDLDSVVIENVIRRFDHKNLNEEIPEFSDVVPTSENLAVVIRKRLNENWNGPPIEDIVLEETRRNRFELRT
jgi:6-pyruvoyltetrahydropterin/6-carboxytetrahydropterin synthase